MLDMTELQLETSLGIDVVSKIPIVINENEENLPVLRTNLDYKT